MSGLDLSNKSHRYLIGTASNTMPGWFSKKIWNEIWSSISSHEQDLSFWHFIATRLRQWLQLRAGFMVRCKGSNIMACNGSYNYLIMLICMTDGSWFLPKRVTPSMGAAMVLYIKEMLWTSCKVCQVLSPWSFELQERFAYQKKGLSHPNKFALMNVSDIWSLTPQNH